MPKDLILYALFGGHFQYKGASFSILLLSQIGLLLPASTQSLRKLGLEGM